MKETELQQLKDDLRAKHPNHKLKPLRLRTGEIIVIRSPTMAERQLLIPKVKRNEDAAAHKQLTLQCAVHPSREDLSELLEKYPFLCETITDKVIEMGGGETEDLGEF